MASSNLAILITAKDLASGELRKVTGEANKAGISWSKALAAAGAVGATAAGALADMAREGAADAAQMEAVRVAVENAGGAWNDAEPALNTYMTRMRDLAAIDDSELKPALASLIAVTGDVEKSMDLASLAADLAKGKNISLAAASELVGKVAQGNTSILTRYGIILDKNATSQEALGILQQKFSGQAETYGKTTAGQLEILKLRLADFREEIGQSLGPWQGMIAMMPGLSIGFSAIGGAIGGLLPGLALLRTALMAQVIPSIVATTIALSPILIPIAAVGAAIALLAVAWSNDWGGIQGKTEAAIGSLTNTFEGFQAAVGPIWQGITESIRTAINGIISAINGLIGAWNAIEFSIPGFNVEIPSIDVPGVGRVGGGSLGWPGLTVGTADMSLIPLLDRGGIVTRPTLALLAANSRPEAVIPLGSSNRAVANVNVYLTIEGSVITERDLIRTVRDGLQGVGRSNLSVGLA